MRHVVSYIVLDVQSSTYCIRHIVWTYRIRPIVLDVLYSAHCFRRVVLDVLYQVIGSVVVDVLYKTLY